MIARALGLLLLLPPGIAGGAPSDAASDEAAIERALAEYESAFNAGDAGRLARTYTDDGVFLPQGGAPVVGSQALEKFWKGATGKGLDLELRWFETSGNVGWAAGTFTFPAAAGGPPSGGTFLVGLRRQPDGSWKLSADTYNTPCPSPSAIAASDEKSVERILVALKHEMGDAYLKRDPAALERIYAEEYVVTDEDGGKRTKADEIRNMKTAPGSYESSEYETESVRVYGDSAVLSGVGTVKGRRATGPFHVRYRSTNVFVRRDGRWQAVAAHISGVERLRTGP